MRFKFSQYTDMSFSGSNADTAASLICWVGQELQGVETGYEFFDREYQPKMNMRILKLLILFLMIMHSTWCQTLETRNVIVVTLDGYRWKEFFNGADERIITNPEYVDDPQVASLFNGGTTAERRERLMPFVWDVIASQGQLYGNRRHLNKVNCKNNHLLSYPGYSEMFVGFSDDLRVSSNKREVNPNKTVFEFISEHEGFTADQISAFTTWDMFPYILRAGQDHIYVSSGTAMAEGDISAREKELNSQLEGLSKRDDRMTFDYAMEYLKRKKPRVLFLGFDGTDENGHGGRYDEYLKSAHAIDGMLAELWSWVQSQPDYKDQTTLFITTDHGRGNGRHSWKNHRLLAPGSRHIWFALIGPDTPAFGEMKSKEKYFQRQVAATLAAFFGRRYSNKRETGEVIQTMIDVPDLMLGNETILGRSGR
jgi:hypothetical protein